MVRAAPLSMESAAGGLELQTLAELEGSTPGRVDNSELSNETGGLLGEGPPRARCEARRPCGAVRLVAMAGLPMGGRGGSDAELIVSKTVSRSDR